MLWNHTKDPITIPKGERFAQIIFIPCLNQELIPLEDPPELTTRAPTSFGSTGTTTITEY